MAEDIHGAPKCYCTGWFSGKVTQNGHPLPWAKPVRGGGGGWGAVSQKSKCEVRIAASVGEGSQSENCCLFTLAATLLSYQFFSLWPYLNMYNKMYNRHVQETFLHSFVCTFLCSCICWFFQGLRPEPPMLMRAFFG